VQYEMVLRLIIAGLIGAVIGFERRSRHKEAGLRTHFLVAVGSCLMMLVSEYGFIDTVGHGVNLDPSRIAAQVVSGIGFLGAGTIMVQRQVVRGLTTAAGLWATAGIGLAIGTGMYVVGISASVLVFIGLEILDRSFKSFFPQSSRLTLHLLDQPDVIRHILDKLKSEGITVVTYRVEMPAENGNNEIIMELKLKFAVKLKLTDLLESLQNLPGIISVDTN